MRTRRSHWLLSTTLFAFVLALGIMEIRAQTEPVAKNTSDATTVVASTALEASPTTVTPTEDALRPGGNAMTRAGVQTAHRALSS